MAHAPYTLMVELLQRIRSETVHVCQIELSKYKERQKSCPNPWAALQTVVSEVPEKEKTLAVTRKQDGFGAFLFKAAGTRLLDNIAEECRKNELSALCEKMESILDEAKMAGMLFAMNAGQSSMPWKGVDVLFPETEAMFSPRIGTLSILPDDLSRSLPQLDWSIPVPAMLPLETGRSVFVSSPPAMRDKATEALHAVALRLLLSAPCGLMRVDVLAPGGVNLGKVPWALWPDSVCTVARQIENKIDRLVTHVNRIMGEKLTGTYSCLQDYNAHMRTIGKTCEPYHVLVVHDCPASLSTGALQKLQVIARSGASCGAFVLIHWTDSGETYAQKKLAEVAGDSVLISWDHEKGRFIWRDEALSDCLLNLDDLPPADFMQKVVREAASAWSARKEMESSYLEEEKAGAVEYVQAILFYCLKAFPPGKMFITFVDPVGNGNNVSPFFPLGTYDKALITEKAWSDPSEIERQLTKLKDCLEEIIQQRLHSESAADVGEYNSRVSLEKAIPYRFVVFFDFPEKLTNNARTTLRNLVLHGLQCGIYVIIVRDKESSLPAGYQMAELRRGNTIINLPSSPGTPTTPSPIFGIAWEDMPTHLTTADVEAVIEKVGKTRKSARESVLDLEKVLAKDGLDDEENWWKGKAIAGFEGLLGFKLAENVPQVCRFDNETAHGIMAGPSGSGKSNFLNVLITSLALRYPPEEVEFFLIDMKQGVGFNHFAKNGLPHARVISNTSDRDFAVSILRSLDEEMSRRGTLFIENEANDIEVYRQKTGKCMSRILLVIDEVKTLYAEGDNNSAYALGFFDRIAAKGRSFGLHLLLVNQSFIGATLKASTMLNIQMRLVSKKEGSETAENVLDTKNDVLKSLLRYQAVYNDGLGGNENNHPCRVPKWTDENDTFIRRLALKVPADFRPTVVFNDDQKGVPLSSCEAFSKNTTAGEPRMWLGLPLSLEPYVSVGWKRESRQNLLIVDQAEEKATGLMGVAWMGLIVSSAPQAQQFRCLDLGTKGKSWSDVLTQVGKAIPDRAHVISPGAPVYDELDDLAKIIEIRESNFQYAEPPFFLIVHGLHRLRDLDGLTASAVQQTPLVVPVPPLAAKSIAECSASILERSGVTMAMPSKQATRRTLRELLIIILQRGPNVGVHVLTWCDNANNIRRVLSQGRLREEFGMLAVGTQADVNDSRELLGNGMAAGLSTNRMVFLNAGDGGHSFVFRPYRFPELSWIQEVSSMFSNDHK